MTATLVAIVLSLVGLVAAVSIYTVCLFIRANKVTPLKQWPEDEEE